MHHNVLPWCTITKYLFGAKHKYVFQMKSKLFSHLVLLWETRVPFTVII